ncbi:bifunctional enoyl-CoA hydratase/phosphate acetyltransferase [Clostridium sp. D2Q-11]|uniref:Bifunctional enoyl-CoA hydratase/phosphate acetyltransferase n=1 Tax=Anaeromonas frigoriresistens TaxID=2683708 RepID=A0A942UX28_9FIRM|nr:bifunctional enoyl-CoA hydratase/phosphate acetyltransferase [Anaeromonas frigoriresistens]
MNSLKEVVQESQKQDTKRLAVAASEDRDVLRAIVEAAELNIIKPILIGDISETKKIAEELGLDIERYEKINTNNLKESAITAVKLVSEGKADFVMKGLIDTSILLKEVLNKDYGLRTDSLLSHVMFYEIPTYHKLLVLTDGGMNIAPSAEEKVSIIKNAVKAFNNLGYEKINVACLAAKEKVNSKMQATVDAEQIKELWDKENSKNVVVEGPLALDLAISKEAAITKGFKSDIAGETDILLAPNIEMGNGIGKSLTYFANAQSAGVIMGAKVPIILVSRADDHQTKLNSIALGSVIA